MNIFITGGAGFIGCNTANYYLRQGHQVTLFDNFSRKGGEANLNWLLAEHGAENLQIIRGDVRDYDTLTGAVRGVDAIIHLAGQVAVTLSVQDPRADFEINALGTFNVLEAIRNHNPAAAFLYASSNKVYGGMEELRIEAAATRYSYADYPHGIPESYPLDFHSPYGCSKGTGDQYTIDYARIYGLKTVVLRQSCIYGQRQFGVEDQGWVAHFIIATVMGRPISIYGDGRQVRDLLHVRDLIRAYDSCIRQIDDVQGDVFNIGGGPDNALSIWAEFGPLLAQIHESPIPVSYSSWRPGDQQVFIADIRRARERLGWQPAIDPAAGIRDLYNWVSQNRHLFN